MKTYANHPSFDDAKFSAVYGKHGRPENGGQWYRAMADGVPTLFYGDDKPTLVNAASFASFQPDEDRDAKLRRPAVRALLTALRAGTATNAQVQNALARVIEYLLDEMQ